MERTWSFRGKTFIKVNGFTRHEKFLDRAEKQTKRHLAKERYAPDRIRKMKVGNRLKKFVKWRHKQASKRRDLLEAKVTAAERKFQSLLEDCNVQYEREHIFWFDDTRYRIVDFYVTFPKHVAIEIDGGYHTSEAIQRYDSWKDSQLLKANAIPTLRFTNVEVANTPGIVLSTLRKYLWG